MLQISQRSQMEESPISQFGLLLIKVENNKIGDKGCKYLSRAEWKLLHKLDLGMGSFK